MLQRAPEQCSGIRQHSRSKTAYDLGQHSNRARESLGTHLGIVSRGKCWLLKHLMSNMSFGARWFRSLISGEVGQNMMVKTCSVPLYSCKGICFAFQSKCPWFRRHSVSPHPFKIPAHQLCPWDHIVPLLPQSRIYFHIKNGKITGTSRWCLCHNPIFNRKFTRNYEKHMQWYILRYKMRSSHRFGANRTGARHWHPSVHAAGFELLEHKIHYRNQGFIRIKGPCVTP